MQIIFGIQILNWTIILEKIQQSIPLNIALQSSHSIALETNKLKQYPSHPAAVKGPTEDYQGHLLTQGWICHGSQVKSQEITQTLAAASLLACACLNHVGLIQTGGCYQCDLFHERNISVDHSMVTPRIMARFAQSKT